MHTDIQTIRCRETCRQTDRQPDIQTYIHTYIHILSNIARIQTDRQYTDIYDRQARQYNTYIHTYRRR